LIRSRPVNIGRWDNTALPFESQTKQINWRWVPHAQLYRRSKIDDGAAPAAVPEATAGRPFPDHEMCQIELRHRAQLNRSGWSRELTILRCRPAVVFASFDLIRCMRKNVCFVAVDAPSFG